ncbi:MULTISPECIES: glycerophosphoryl diester phosphodiesterase membrane domain-containing protein [unclassified Streptomyces]|uniref:glycerophosphoryl diester phosphodiesterase membrane domain-containing protein n=1 Tax=unclassified Streptomyces TaxID=2593676 RepID=UPI002E2DE933|nr:hypothetical protein [Streptomyces sp. NBC_00223]
MTNTPGWATPGPSDSPEPDDGASPTTSSAPTPTSGSGTEATGPTGSTPAVSVPAPSGAETSGASAVADTVQDTPPPTAAAGHPGWSHQQPPAEQGWARWTPPQNAQPPKPPQQGGPRWGGGAPMAGGWQQQGPWSKPQAPKPGVIPLRPLGVGEILDGAIAILRRYWRAIVGFTFAVALVTQGVGIVLQGTLVDNTRLKSLQNDPDPSLSDVYHAFRSTLLGSALAVLVIMVGLLVATAMLTMVTSRAVLGHKVTAGEAWRDARPRVLQLIGLTLLLLVIYCGVLGLAVLPGVLISLAGAEDGGAMLASLGLVGGFVVVLWLWIQWSLASPALMLEKQGIVSAMKRSAKLVRGKWWRVLGVQLLSIALVYIASTIIDLPFTLLAGAITGDDFTSFLNADTNPGWSFLIISGVGSVLGATITLPISAGVTALLYMDQRIRRESLDLELARAAQAQPQGQSQGQAN